MKPTEHNEMENKALKEHLASAALQMLAEGTDYENLAGPHLPVRVPGPRLTVMAWRHSSSL